MNEYEKLYNEFVENDTFCISYVKNRIDSFNKISNNADSFTELDFPFTYRVGNTPSSVGICSFKISKWFEEFEYVDSWQKCLEFMERIAKIGKRYNLENQKYYLSALNKFKNYDWSIPLIFIISDRMLICDTMRLYGKNICRLENVQLNNSSYLTDSLNYILKNLIIYNERPNVKIVKHRNVNYHQKSLIHDSSWHDCFESILTTKCIGTIGYSVRHVIQQMISNDIWQYDYEMQEAKSRIEKIKTDKKELIENLSKLELTLTAMGY